VRLLFAGPLAIILIGSLGSARSNAQSTDRLRPAPASLETVIDEAFRAAYNLDEPEAFDAARRAVKMAPGEPASHRALASILWLAIMYHRGSVFTDNLVSGALKNQTGLPKPPPQMAGEFARELQMAIDLAEARLRRNPKDVQAHFDAGAAYALQASYAGMVDGQLLGAMRIAKRAYDAQEYVLDHAPHRVEAGLVVGTYRYLVATLSLPARWMAYIVGFGGGKERGISMVETSMQAPETRLDSRVALLLIYNREKRYDDAVRLSRELQREFPRNRLFVLEEGSAATRAGRPAEAEAALTRGLAAYDRETRPKVDGERAVWLYKRAVARIGLRHLAEAEADLAAALAERPADWTRGRIQLEVGRVADLRGRRADAVAAYRQANRVCEARNDEVCANEAERLIRRPFK
jgi:tetratricopeptide (TPR) repeat protein